jgi:hypothetical protein
MTPKSLREGFELYKQGKPFGKPDDGPRHAMFGLVVDEIEALKESIGTQTSVADLERRIAAMETTIGNALGTVTASWPEWLSYDKEQDVLTVYGMHYAPSLFKEWSITGAKLGTTVRIVSRDDGVVTLQSVDPWGDENKARERVLASLKRLGFASDDSATLRVNDWEWALPTLHDYAREMEVTLEHDCGGGRREVMFCRVSLACADEELDAALTDLAARVRQRTEPAPIPIKRAPGRPRKEAA